MPGNKPSISDVLKERARLARMAGESPPPDDPTNKALDREHDAQFNLTTPAENIVLVSINQLCPYSNHPFKPYTDERMDALVENIRKEGLHQPIIIRKLDCLTGYEILAGHNRVEAMRRLGERDIHAIVRDLDDDNAALVVVSTNLKQREKLLPSEKAFAYKLQMEALQRQKEIIRNGGSSSDFNGMEQVAQNGQPGISREIVADSNGVDRHEIQRYIRLTLLLPELLDLLDSEAVPVMAGYEISFLDTDAQQAVLQYFFAESKPKEKLTVKAAEAIRAAYHKEQPVTEDSIPAILNKPKKKPGPQKVSLSSKELKRIAIPKGIDVGAVALELLIERYGLAETA